jgi:hypothetical protein
MKYAKKVKWHDEEASIKSLNVHTVIDIFNKKRPRQTNHSIQNALALLPVKQKCLYFSLHQKHIVEREERKIQILAVKTKKDTLRLPARGTQRNLKIIS